VLSKLLRRRQLRPRNSGSRRKRSGENGGGRKKSSSESQRRLHGRLWWVMERGRTLKVSKGAELRIQDTHVYPLCSLEL
jgi:hypothetical protein